MANKNSNGINDSNEIAVKVSHVGKTFHESQGAGSFKEAFVNIGRKLRGKKEKRIHKGEYAALKDIAFEIKKGEFFGIVGRNGCGKSTLLKIIAGVYSPTRGGVQVNGALTPFIELGVGFNPELSGRDNVFLNGALLGFTRKQMEEMYDDIVEFAELKEFMNMKLKNYSSGMQVRLAFSVAIRAESDILLIDEVLAVGDEAFQQKCFSYFRSLKSMKKTVIFVTHDMSAVRQYCDRGIIIENGKVLVTGDSLLIAKQYTALNIEDVKNDTNTQKDKLIPKFKLEIIDSRTFKRGEYMNIKISWKNDSYIKKINGCGVAIWGINNEYIFGANTFIDRYIIKKNSIKYRFKIEFGQGQYRLYTVLFGEDENHIIDSYDGPIFSVQKRDTERSEGLFNLERKWFS